MPTEKYTTRDLMLQMVGAQKELLEHFSNGKFVTQLQKGVKDQTEQIIKEIAIVQVTTEETKGIMSWVRYISIGIIGTLSVADLAIISLYIRELIK